MPTRCRVAPRFHFFPARPRGSHARRRSVRGQGNPAQEYASLPSTGHRSGQTAVPNACHSLRFAASHWSPVASQSSNSTRRPRRPHGTLASQSSRTAREARIEPTASSSPWLPRHAPPSPASLLSMLATTPLTNAGFTPTPRHRGRCQGVHRDCAGLALLHACCTDA